MKMNDFLDDLGKALPLPRKKSLAKNVALIAAIVILSLGISALTIYFFPHIKEFGKYGYLGVFLASLISSSTVLMPAPGPAVVIVAATIWNPAWVAVVASIGGTIGEMTGYLVGFGGRSVIVPRLSGRYGTAERWMKRYGGWAIFVLAAIPFPLFDLVGIAAGAAKFSWWKFLLFCWLGRLPKSFVEAYIGIGLFHLFSQN